MARLSGRVARASSGPGELLSWPQGDAEAHGGRKTRIVFGQALQLPFSRSPSRPWAGARSVR
jgi:hypothetical protein